MAQHIFRRSSIRAHNSLCNSVGHTTVPIRSLRFPIAYWRIYSSMPFTISAVVYGLTKFIAPTATPVAPASMNSIASSAFAMPPMPMIGILTAFAA